VLTGRATSVPFTAFITGAERTTTDNTNAVSRPTSITPKLNLEEL
jgi:hypothetical protein